MVLQEIKIRKKKKVGSGYFQNVYQIVNMPGMVLKVPIEGGEYEPYEYNKLELAQKNPEVFAKVYVLKPNFVVMEELSPADRIF